MSAHSRELESLRVQEPLPGPVVRSAIKEDLAVIQRIYAAHVLGSTGTFEETPPDVSELARRWHDVTSRGLPYLVVVEDRLIKGFAYAGPFRSRSAYRYTVEDSIYIDQDAVGRGLGGMLLASLISRCSALGLRQMIAVIGDSANLRSIHLHGRFGFSHAGVLVNVGLKFDRWLDAVFMQRTLSDNPAGVEDRR